MRPDCSRALQRSSASSATRCRPRATAREVIASCGTGVSATVALIALELAGVHGAGVYDGSFSEWSADPSRPIAYGGAG